MMMSALHRRTRWIAPLAALLVVGGVLIERLSYGTPEDAAEYHRQVAAAIDAIPLQIGDWVGEEIPVPQSAVELLQPNALLSRRYHNQRQGQDVALLVVHCRDARDLAGHYPPICYRAHGWTQRHVTSFQSVLLGAEAAEVLEYDFTMSLPTHSRMMTVQNILVLPDGTVTPDIKAVRRAASDYRSHYFGAGQIQLVFAQGMSSHERHAIWEEFAQALRPVIEAIASGVGP